MASSVLSVPRPPSRSSSSFQCVPLSSRRSLSLWPLPTMLKVGHPAICIPIFSLGQSYWARDLIFLFVDGGDKIAAEAWFADYHGHHHPFIQSSGGDDADFHLELHGGQIIGAFVLDFSGNVFSQVDLQFSMASSFEQIFRVILT